MKKTLRLLKFGADWCGPCSAMKKAHTLEKLAEAHPELDIEEYTLETDEDGEEVESEDNKKFDEFNVSALPTFILTDMEGNKLVEDSGAMNLASLGKLVDRAAKKLAGKKGER